MKDANIIIKVNPDFKERFKTHCGLIDMSTKIRDLIETDMNKKN